MQEQHDFAIPWPVQRWLRREPWRQSVLDACLMQTIITSYMHTNSTLGVSAGSPHTSVSRMTVLQFSGLVLDTGNCSGLHIYTAEGIGCHKSSWQSLGRHIYAEDSSPSAPQIHTNVFLYWFLIGITSDFAPLIGHRSWVCCRPS